MMTPEFEAARSRYIKAWKEMKESVMLIAMTADKNKVQKIMDDVAKDLAKIEDAGWDAIKVEE